MAVNIGGAVKTGGAFTTLFRFFWRYKLFLFFMAFILVNIVIVDVQENKSNEIPKDVYTKIFNPLGEVQNASLQIIEQQGFWDDSISTLKNIGNSFDFIWTIFFGIYTVWLWIKLFRFLFLKINTSERFTATLIGTIVYLLIQMIYLASVGENIFTPITAFIDFFRALPYLIKPIANVGEKFNDLKSSIF